MSRRPLTMQEEMKLQEPMLEALDNYFDAAYTQGSESCTVGTAATSGDKVLVISAFRVPREMAEFTRLFLMGQAELFAKGMTTVDTAPDFSDTTH